MTKNRQIMLYENEKLYIDIFKLINGNLYTILWLVDKNNNTKINKQRSSWPISWNIVVNIHGGISGYKVVPYQVDIFFLFPSLYCLLQSCFCYPLSNSDISFTNFNCFVVFSLLVGWTKIKYCRLIVYFMELN